MVAEFEQSQSRLCQLLDAAKVERNISNMLEKQPHLTKRVVDQLKDLPSEKQGEVYREAEKTAPNGKVTAAHVQNRERWRGSTNPSGINPEGDIVGFYKDSGGNFHGFLLSKGRFTTIDVPAAFGIGTQAYGINPEGDIVGFYSDGSGITHGFLLSKW